MATTTSATASTLSLAALPAELQHQILTHLSVATLLTYARTSRQNYSNSLAVLTTLQLAVLPRRIHGVLAFLNASPTYSFADEDPTYLQQIVVPSSPSSSTSTPQSHRLSHHSRSANLSDPRVYRQNLISQQTTRTSQILLTPLLANLTSLTLHTYSISSSSSSPASNTDTSLASTLATRLPFLRHLTLNFAHSYVHDTSLPARYWSTPERGSPAWNALCGIGSSNRDSLRLTGLETLKVCRAGLTARQLGEWVARNQRLSELRLRCVAGVESEFVRDLALLYSRRPPSFSSTSPLAAEPELEAERGRQRRASLKVLCLEDSPNLRLASADDFDWVDTLVNQGLEVLSLRQCGGVDAAVLREVCLEKEWESRGLKRLVLPGRAAPPQRWGGYDYDYGRRSLSDDGELFEDEDEEGLKQPKSKTEGVGMGADGGLVLEVDPAWL